MDSELNIRRFLEAYEAVCDRHGLMVGGGDTEDSLDIMLYTLCPDHKKEALEAALAMLRFRASEGSEDGPEDS